MGHYCRICGRTRANERFSGKGHKKHICKECSKLSVSESDEMTIINQIYSLCLYVNLSKVNRRMLEGYLLHKSDKVRVASKEILKEFALFKYNDSPSWMMMNTKMIVPTIIMIHGLWRQLRKIIIYPMKMTCRFNDVL